MISKEDVLNLIYKINIDKETIEYIWREWNELGRPKVK